MTQADPTFAPCPFCGQFNHSIGEDELAQAFRYFHQMEAHPLHGRPMGYAFDEDTRRYAQVLIAAAKIGSDNGR